MTAAPIQPPDIRHLKSMGLTGARIDCLKCARRRDLTWEEIGLADETPFPEILSHRRFVCTGCGSRQFTIMPDWWGYRAQGGG